MTARNRALIATGIAALAAATTVALGLGVPARAALIASVCVTLWLTGGVRVWVPTLVLWIATPLLLGTIDSQFAPLAVLRWSVDPVLALFLGGFALAAAAQRHGVDNEIAAMALRRAGHSSARLVAAAALSTALLSMWMSNVAAAALMLNAFRPIWAREPNSSPLRRSLLLAIALAADVGGVATPIGSGPNGIAMAAVEHTLRISFLQWMAFGVPLAIGLVAAVIALVIIGSKPPRTPVAAIPPPPAHASNASQARSKFRLGVVFAVTVVLWLSEPLHGIPAWMVALGAVGALIVFRVLNWRDLVRLDWGTLVLVAGGIRLGALLDHSGIIRDFAAGLPLSQAPMVVRLFGLCLLSASLSALMSNTGTVALLIPLAATIDPAASTAILVAIASSLGVPFVISTPPNAMAVAGGLRTRDLLWPGLTIMLGGCVLIALTGPWVLRLVGIP